MKTNKLIGNSAYRAAIMAAQDLVVALVMDASADWGDDATAKNLKRSWDELREAMKHADVQNNEGGR